MIIEKSLKEVCKSIVKSVDNIKRCLIRSLLDQMQKHIRALKSLNKPVETWSTLLIVIVKENLTPFSQEKLEEQNRESFQLSYKGMIIFFTVEVNLDTRSYQIISVSPKILSIKDYLKSKS